MKKDDKLALIVWAGIILGAIVMFSIFRIPGVVELLNGSNAESIDYEERCAIMEQALADIVDLSWDMSEKAYEVFDGTVAAYVVLAEGDTETTIEDAVSGLEDSQSSYIDLCEIIGAIENTASEALP